MKKILISLLIFSFIFKTNVKAEDLSLAENAKSAIMIEASTGKVIYEKNADEKLAPASMTKIMTMLLVIENIENGRLKWDDYITVSANASGMGGSQILLETGEKMLLSDVFKGLAVASGNDAAVALAEYTAGTEEEFVKMMNKRAKELKLTNTNFKNVHGFDEANHYTSARDMANLSKELVKHAKVLEYTSIYEDYLRKGTNKETWLVNTNKLVRFYDGVDGLKTGFTDQAGYCLTTTALKNDMRLITVVMKEPDTKTRNSETSKMLDYGFAQYEVEKLLSKTSIIDKVNIDKAKKQNISIVPLEEIIFLNKKSDAKTNATYELILNKLKAPLKKGDVVGKLIIKENDKFFREINVTVSEDVKKSNIVELFFRYLGDIFTGKTTI
jgi:D-alanyl-D-alanine carboxypeptidase (penicillin-binding protein 5/6)